MIRILTFILIFVATLAHAGFKMYGPGGYIESSETEEEKAARAERDAYYQKIIDDARAQHPPLDTTTRPDVTPEPTYLPPPVIKEYDDNGKRPGREARRNLRKTGFRNKQEFENHYGKTK